MRQRGGGGTGESAPAVRQKGPGNAAAGESSWTRRLAFVRWSGDQGYDALVSLGAVLVLVCLCAELSSSTAYGRFGLSATVGLDPRLGWFLMELPCSLVFFYAFWIRGGPQARRPVPLLLGALFQLHYVYRGWLFPYLMRVHPGSRNFSVVPALFSWMVTVPHALLSARWLAAHGKHLTTRWLRDPRFWIGLVAYYSGLALIIWHDHILRVLRPCPNGERYCVPRGGLFEYATCAQYLAELWAWAGFAILFWGPNGLYIFLVSLVNLVPRAAQTHTWYLERFEGYGELGRARLVPFFW